MFKFFYREAIWIEQRQVARAAPCPNREQVFENCVPSGKQVILPLAQLRCNYFWNGGQSVIHL